MDEITSITLMGTPVVSAFPGCIKEPLGFLKIYYNAAERDAPVGVVSNFSIFLLISNLVSSK